MPLKGKYIKYSPEITLEIFILIYNKLINSGWIEYSNKTIEVSYSQFKDRYNYLTHQEDKTFNTHVCPYKKEYAETTVQEILGYDPFVKDDFVLPEKWCILADGYGDIGKYFNKQSAGECYTYESGYYHRFNDGNQDITIGGNLNKSFHKYNIKNHYVEITFEQFKKYVLKSTKEPKAESKEVIPEYVEYNKIIYKVKEWTSNSYCRLENGQEPFKKLVKSSSKADYDAQKQPKQPLKQAVHCKTQEEWDFVTEKLGYKWSEQSRWSVYKNDTCIDLKKLGFGTAKIGYKEYQIFSFQEWCDLNGYKMEKEVKFEVGKWYKYENWYLKYFKHDDGIWTASEYITDTKSYSNFKACFGRSNLDSEKVLASIEEIQQYLPDNHPDKIKSNLEFKVGDFVIIKSWHYDKTIQLNQIAQIKAINSTSKTPYKLDMSVAPKESITSIWYFKLGEFIHATPEEINNHLTSIGQIPAGEPLNTGIEPNKDGMFKYKTVPGTSWSGGTIQNHLEAMIPTTGNCYNKDFATSYIPIKSKMTLSIDDEELPMVNIIKTNSIKQLLNND